MTQSTISIEELKKKLIEDAEKKAREIIENGEREARKIIENAEKEWKEKAENERMKILDEAKRDYDKVLSEARVKARLIINSVKNNIFIEIFNEVSKRIENRDNIDAYTSLKNLLEESLIYIDKPKKIFVDPRDVEIIEKLIKEKKIGNVEIIVLNNILGGLIIEDSEGRRIDNSYKTRLERAKKILGPYVTKYLWSKGSQ